jgi:ferric-dicitrate binding protein FerR (iron transport regulator)
MSQIPWEHIQNKLRNQDSPDDKTVENWIEEDSDNQSVFDELKVVYSIAGNTPKPFVPQNELAWQKIRNRLSAGKQPFGIIRILLRLAASVLLIALGVGGTLYLENKPNEDSFTEVYSPYGHKTRVQLPDGSQVWLNGDTKLKYNTDFANFRSVELTGEALFEVAKNPQKLFAVKSENLKIEVYGTTFNLKSYPGDQVSEVALVEGSVGLFHDQHLLKKMVPGEVVSFNSVENKFSSRKDDMSQITAWRADELIIEGQTFENVSKYLERWYGVKITLDESVNYDVRLSFKVKTESLTELLSIISHLTPMTYEISGKQVVVSGPKKFKK